MRRVRRKGGNKEKVFGCDLLDHLTASSQEIPQVLQCCSEFVENHGIVDGIYRLSGVSSNIQKLRSEFESDGSPDLHKDVYLQDIHCVSSLCKAYFRELPNPLLTYQLYDKFAEAVAIQLEEERLVKIRDVLKDLPAPHYRTLEFLMRHLVKMASYSSETNMHSRNLAIVWAPNLLRSKDIEASGFNGTAAFMEVRVQSIVVEFILTHVPQLFPEQGVSKERRKSLPSPSAIPNQEEGFFKSPPTQPVPHFGNISPGDGPLPIRPYHAIIEGTDKRKGSLKGRKWMSIFNIGGRFHDPRRRHKHSAKEKERPALRPARSMDSLSTPPYPNEGTRRSGQRPPSTNLSPLVTGSSQSGSEITKSAGAIGGSEYAVTYRRGTGLVSGGAGTQGTYTSLDPEGLGHTGNETLQSKSPGLSNKSRRAAMHITGPTIVTVPLHITSNLALGVLQGGGGDRIIHRCRDKDGGDKVEGKEGGEKVERRDWKVEKIAKEEKNLSEKVTDREEVVDAEETTVAGVGGKEEGEGEKEEEKEEKEEEEEKEKEEEEVREECKQKLKPVVGGQDESREQRVKSVTSNTDEDNAFDDEYMDMRGVKQADCEPEVTQHADDCVLDASNVLNSSEVDEDDQEMSGYVQDNFEFLDQMDCSVLDHMDCSVPYQVNEFSVEPPGHSDDEYEVMEQVHPAELQTDQQPGAERQTQSQAESNPHRPLSLDSYSRHTKSLSLPYMTSPVHGSEGSCSEEEGAVDNSDSDDYSSEDDSMFFRSLPADMILKDLTSELDTDKQDISCTPDGVPVHPSQSSQSLKLEFSCKELTAGDLEQIKVKDKGGEDGLEEKEKTKKKEEDHQGSDQLENKRQSKATEEDAMEDSQSDKDQPLTLEASTHCCADFPLPSDDKSNAMADLNIEEEVAVFDIHYSDDPPCCEVLTQKDTSGVSLDEFREFSVRTIEQPTKERDSSEVEDEDVCKEIEDIMALEIKESDENMWEETTIEGNEVIAEVTHEDEMQGDDEGQDSTSEIWVEIEDVICEVIEDEESMHAQMNDARENIAEEGEQVAKVSGEGMMEVDEGETNKTSEVAEESIETTEDKLTDPQRQQEFEEKKETNLPKTSELEEEIQEKHDINDEAQHHDREEVFSKENNDKERVDEQCRMEQPSVDKQLKEVRCDMKELKEGKKYEESDSSQGGVGRKLVIAKHPRVYQVKAVPVVPPKPQHCKITALTLRQQQQQRDSDRGRENTVRVPTEQDRVCAGDEGEDDSRGEKEKPTLGGGEKAEKERRRDGEESASKDTSRNSPLSISFDEAVAIATMRREKEKECEKEKQRDWGNEVQ